MNTAIPVKQPVRLPALKRIDPTTIGKFKKILLVGDTGAGKTLLAGTAARDPRVDFVLYIDTEGTGTETLADIAAANPEKLFIKSVDPDDIDPDNIAPDAIYKAMISLYTAAKELTREPSRTVVVVIDSMTVLAENTIAEISGNDKTVRSGGLPKGVRQDQWGTEKGYIEQITRLFRALPCHLVVTCRQHNRYETRMIDNKPIEVLTEIQVQLPGSRLTENYPSMFGQVLFLRTEPGIGSLPPTHTLQSQEDGLRKAKDRSQRLPVKIKNATFTTLLDSFMKERKDA
jgi:hypothetical protein